MKKQISNVMSSLILMSVIATCLILFVTIATATAEDDALKKSREEICKLTDNLNNVVTENNKLKAEILSLKSNISDLDFFRVKGYGMIMGCLVLALALVAIGISTYLLKCRIGYEDIIATYGLILILSYSIFILIAGYDKEQIAPVYGLMGTAMGYIFGKSQSKKSDPNKADEHPDNKEE